MLIISLLQFKIQLLVNLFIISTKTHTEKSFHLNQLHKIWSIGKWNKDLERPEKNIPCPNYASAIHTLFLNTQVDNVQYAKHCIQWSTSWSSIVTLLSLDSNFNNANSIQNHQCGWPITLHSRSGSIIQNMRIWLDIRYLKIISYMVAAYLLLNNTFSFGYLLFCV